jgi:hypothetical protein
VRCPQCGLLVWDEYQFCYECGYNIKFGGVISINYKMKSGKVFSDSELRKIQKATAGMESDLIQPTREYDRVHKTWTTNRDFVKLYGDPFKNQK